MLAESEKQIENRIINFLRIIGIFCWKNQSVGIFDPKKKVFRRSNNINHLRGVSDILGIVNGRFLAVEVKSEKGRLTIEQKAFLQNIRAQGGIAFEARSLSDVARHLKDEFPDNIGLQKMAGEVVEREKLRIDN